ncbi:MAG: hypothetical protein ACK2T0_09485, partial [Anaerolineales bacterium]
MAQKSASLRGRLLVDHQAVLVDSEVAFLGTRRVRPTPPGLIPEDGTCVPTFKRIGSVGAGLGESSVYFALCGAEAIAPERIHVTARHPR